MQRVLQIQVHANFSRPLLHDRAAAHFAKAAVGAGTGDAAVLRTRRLHGLEDGGDGRGGGGGRGRVAISHDLLADTTFPSELVDSGVLQWIEIDAQSLQGGGQLEGSSADWRVLVFVELVS
jgi:hypothetical protein